MLFITNSIHVVFGHVVSGHDIVRQIEALPVDRNSRPLQDVIISNCGELIKQIKGTYWFCNLDHDCFINFSSISLVKKVKKKKEVSKSASDSESSDEEKKKKSKSKKKKKKAKSEE